MHIIFELNNYIHGEDLHGNVCSEVIFAACQPILIGGYDILPRRCLRPNTEDNFGKIFVSISTSLPRKSS